MAIRTDMRTDMRDNFEDQFARTLLVELAVFKNCGTGAGGFQPRNTCAAEDGLSESDADTIFARIKAEGGFTYQPIKDISPESGYAVAVVPDAVKVFDVDSVTRDDILDYLVENRDVFDDPNMHVGGWIDNGKFYLDLSRVETDLEIAKQLGAEHKQLSIFDLANKQVIDLETDPEKRAELEKEQQAIADARKAERQQQQVARENRRRFIRENQRTPDKQAVKQFANRAMATKNDTDRQSDRSSSGGSHKGRKKKKTPARLEAELAAARARINEHILSTVRGRDSYRGVKSTTRPAFDAILKAAKFEEEKHHRDNAGRFASREGNAKPTDGPAKPTGTSGAIKNTIASIRSTIFKYRADPSTLPTHPKAKKALANQLAEALGGLVGSLGGGGGVHCGGANNSQYVPDRIGSWDATTACDVHDACYTATGTSREECDAQFRLDLKDAGFPELLADTYWLAVRLGGESEYWEKEQESEAKAKSLLFALMKNCGTGAGGFQDGNDCARKGDLPDVMYHGTEAEFDEFDSAKGSKSGTYGAGIYFSNDEPLARQFSGGKEPKSAKLNLKNPYIVDRRSSDYNELARVFRQKGSTEKLLAKGHDGVIVHDGDFIEAVVFDAKSIDRKSKKKSIILKGGEGSGNFGHAGRPGEVGGSAPDDGGSSAVVNDKWPAGSAIQKIKYIGPPGKHNNFAHFESKTRASLLTSDYETLTGQKVDDVPSGMMGESITKSLKKEYIRYWSEKFKSGEKISFARRAEILNLYDNAKVVSYEKDFPGDDYSELLYVHPETIAELDFADQQRQSFFEYEDGERKVAEVKAILDLPELKSIQEKIATMEQKRNLETIEVEKNIEKLRSTLATRPTGVNPADITRQIEQHFQTIAKSNEEQREKALEEIFGKPEGGKLFDIVVDPSGGGNLTVTDREKALVKSVHEARDFFDKTGVSRVYSSAFEKPIMVSHTPDGTAYYRASEDAITMNAEIFGTSTAIHELTHAIEQRWFANTSFQDRAAAFIYSQSKEFAVPRLPATESQGSPTIAIFEDNFENRYSGRVYGKTSGFVPTEIFSTGVEQMYIDPIKFAKDHPEQFKLTVAFLNGKFVK